MTSRDRPDDLPAKVVAALDRLTRAQRAHRQAIAEQQGLSPLQIEVLRTLANGTPPEPVVGQLAAELAVRQPTVTDSVRALERKGLLERRQDPADARRTRLALTPAGARAVATVASSDEALLEAVARLGTDVQEATLTSLLGLIATMVEAGAITVARTCLTCRFHEQPGPTRHHCTLLEIDLPPAQLRVNCPEHEVSASVRAG